VQVRTSVPRWFSHLGKPPAFGVWVGSVIRSPPGLRMTSPGPLLAAGRAARHCRSPIDDAQTLFWICSLAAKTAVELCTSRFGARPSWSRRRRKGRIEWPEEKAMRVPALAFTLLLAHFAVASAQTATPDSENGRYSFYPMADGVLRLDTRTGQISQCSRSDAGWACKVVPDERSALETEVARLQGENGR
jgi:hypothetical protein